MIFTLHGSFQLGQASICKRDEKAGRSKPPLELLKMAGVDLSSPEPIRRGLEVFDSLVTELDELIE